ncbi:MAG: hypothetical protein IPK72_08770 [Candidatus Eisenbacteria bacterium]|nr:hypothetical protein [Candidatus Eisenbacteria bacterium]
MSENETKSETIIATEDQVTVRKNSVQIRLDQNGPKKGDGRRGIILIEDMDAPYAVAQWLQSPKCLKATKEKIGKSLIIFINDKQITLDSDSIPDADDPHRAPPPTAPQVAGVVPLSSDAMRVAASYQARLEGMTEKMERDLESAREIHRRELAALRDQRDKEIARCEAAIEAARGRLEKEINREEKEMELLSARRRMVNVERSELASDVVKTQETFTALRERVSQLEKPSTIQSVVEGVDILAKNEAVGDLVMKAIFAWKGMSK